MNAIKIIFTLLTALLIGFGLWYVVFLFLTNEFNPMNWHWITKVIYLFFGLSSASGILKELE